MSRTLYQLYQNKVFVLAKTMVVKFDRIAFTINKELMLKGYSVSEDETTWKYYMTLNGEYHESDQDRLTQLTGLPYMTIQVAGESGPMQIPFTRDLFLGNQADIATAIEYSYGSEYYNALLQRYPEFEPLILGILNPVPKDIAISAANGDILYAGGYQRTPIDHDPTSCYFNRIDTSKDGFNDDSLIEIQETNLLPQLETWIKGFWVRWYISDYGNVNDLFLASWLGVMFCNLPKQILNIRLNNCLTHYAHSFHIREYLESMGKLGNYVDYLDLKPLIYLYQNITDLDANMGKSETLDKLVTNVLTPMKIPLSGFDIKHHLGRVRRDIVPRVRMVRTTINFRDTGIGADLLTVPYVLAKQVKLARSNHLDIDKRANDIIYQVAHSQYARLPTKILESAMIDDTDKIMFPMNDALLNLWIYCAVHGTYTGTVYATHPTTGDRIQLLPKNAYILALYCFNKGYNHVTLDLIPTVNARNIPRQVDYIPHPKLYQRPDATRVYRAVSNKHVRFEQVEAMVGNDIVQTQFKSTESFHRYGRYVQQRQMERYALYAKEEDRVARGHLEFAASQMYWLAVPCELAKDTHYSDWLKRQGLDLSDLQPEDFIKLGLELTERATGVNYNRKTIAQKQEAVMGIVQHFISYATHVIYNTASGSNLMIDGKGLRFGNWRDVSKAQYGGGISLKNKHDISEVGISSVDIGQPTPLDLHDMSCESADAISFAILSRQHISGIQDIVESKARLARIDVLNFEVIEIVREPDPLPEVKPDVTLTQQLSSPTYPYILKDKLDVTIQGVSGNLTFGLTPTENISTVNVALGNATIVQTVRYFNYTAGLDTYITPHAPTDERYSIDVVEVGSSAVEVTRYRKFAQTNVRTPQTSSLTPLDSVTVGTPILSSPAGITNKRTIVHNYPIEHVQLVIENVTGEMTRA